MFTDDKISKYYKIIYKLTDNQLTDIRILKKDSYSSKTGPRYCPVCNADLNKNVSVVPIGRDRSAIVNGFECKNCNCLYVDNKAAINGVLRDNCYAKNYTLNGRVVWNSAWKKYCTTGK